MDDSGGELLDLAGVEPGSSYTEPPLFNRKLDSPAANVDIPGDTVPEEKEDLQDVEEAQSDGDVSLGEGDVTVEVVSRPRRKYADEDMQDPNWSRHEKHFFVLSNAGKPIYARYGNEDKLATIMGVMQALISFVQDESDVLRSITAGNHKFVFVCKGPIILVAVTSTFESEAQLAVQLGYIHSQILSVLTGTQLTRIFEQRRNYDLRRLLAGTDRFIDSLIHLMDYDPSFLLGAVRCLPLLSSVRDKIGAVLQAARPKDLLFAVMVARDQLITLLRPKQHSLHPADLHLVFNLVHASSSFTAGESWTPLCLPRFNSKGFLHAHVSYLDNDNIVCLLLICTNKDAFFEMSTARGEIAANLEACGALATIKESLARENYRIAHVDIPDLRHFIYKSKTTAQYTSPTLEAPYSDRAEQKRLFRQYQFLHNRVHSEARPLKLYYLVGSKEIMLAWITTGFELYSAFSPLTTKPASINAINRLLRWIKREEDKLFILNSQLF